MTIDLDKAFANKNVLVTGGLGFIGSNLVHRLASLNARVVVVDSLIPEYGGNPFNLEGLDRRVRVNVADIRDPYCIAYLVQGQDYIFNLAGQVSHLDSVKDPLTDLEINCRAQLSLLEACRRLSQKPKLVYASTRQMYGRPQYLPVDEKHPVLPIDPNGINKMAGEYYHLLYSELYGLHACSLRLTNTYGPRMRICDARQTFIGWWFRQIVLGEQIRVYGDGEQERDLNFVDDVVEAFLLAAISRDSAGQVFNLGAEPISLKSLARLLAELNGSGSFTLVPFPEDRKPIDIGNYQGDYGKIRSVLAWKPKTPLREGLLRTIEYYRRCWKHYLPETAPAQQNAKAVGF
jgi:UDP-glucose 4-epimerase